MQYLVPLSEEIQNGTLIITEMKILICLNSLIYVCMYAISLCMYVVCMLKWPLHRACHYFSLGILKDFS